MNIRDALSSDAEAIAAIYNDAVTNTTAIWNTATVDMANREAWLGERGRQGYPVLVATDETGDVIGFASFGDWRAWEGYRYTVEHSVYVRADQRGGGVGEALLVELIGRARAADKHVMVAGIEARNLASIRLHAKLGFETVGLMRQVGAKFGDWLDLTFMLRILDDRTTPDDV